MDAQKFGHMQGRKYCACQCGDDSDKKLLRVESHVDPVIGRVSVVKVRA